MKLTLEQYLSQYHTAESVKSYGYNIRHFLAVNPKAKQYSYSDVVSYMDRLNKHYTNEVTKGTMLSAIKKYYDYLQETGQRNDHPCRSLYVKRPKHQVQLQNLFTSEELVLLLKRENRYKDLEYRDKAIISLLIYQGMRSEEVTKLSLHHLDFDAGTIYIPRTKIGNPRLLEMHRNQTLMLDRYLEHSRPNLYKGTSDKLFYSKIGQPLSVETLGRMLRPLRGLFPDRQLNANTIRQSVIANWLNKKNYPLGDVQIMAGHKYPSSTERYLSKDPNSQRKLINKYHPLQ